MKKILVVDDDEMFRDIFDEILTQAGHTVVCVDSGEAALKHARAHHLDFILMDIHMKHMSGIEAIRALRADKSINNMPILAVTGMSGNDLYDEIYAAGADGYITKALDAKQLLKRINQMLSSD
ncbi:MAG: hypothetical protein COB59_01410 [Rhodospirillaceae bacterium]|nr:MAG: hypothetical protein COB59_01410 [Rhodospirillaceae bacterium]